LGKDEILELEPAIHPKVHKANSDDENAVFTMVPQLPSKYLPTTYMPIYYLIFVLVNVYICCTNKWFIVHQFIDFFGLIISQNVCFIFFKYSMNGLNIY